MKKFHDVRLVILLVSILSWNAAQSQDMDAGSNSLQLHNLKAFKPASKNWSVAGDVSCSPFIKNDINASKGKGVLVNLPKENGNEDIFTRFEHGDIDLEFDFMMAKGSNSGVYLQGRYELQLLDSWGVKNPRYSDCGGIYERWDDTKPEGDKGYEGTPPRLNASRAPGLWQTMKVKFRAPKFNGKGEKIEDAKFLEVSLNGVVIQENVTLTGPTRGSAYEQEGPLGPIRIQGDHGPVALRNIRYKLYTSDQVSVQDLHYNYYVGSADPKDLPEDVISTFKQTQKEVNTDRLTWNYGDEVNDFGLVITGNLKVPVEGNYNLSLILSGGGTLEVNNQLLVDLNGQHYLANKPGEIKLTAGSHPFKITYYKVTSWITPALGLLAEGPGILQHPLHAKDAVPDRNPVSEIFIQEVKDPYILRGFVDFKGEKKTHCASVGYPEGTNFAIDLNTGNILNVWKGGFCNVTPVWKNRGGGSNAPLGSVINLTDAPVIAKLNSSDAAWSAKSPEDEYKFKGYKINSEGQPVFNYQLDGVDVQDFIFPYEDKGLTRKLTLQGGDAGNLWCRLAVGKDIVQQKDGTFLIDDKKYYLTVENAAGVKPVIRSSEEGKEILLPLDNLQEVQYTLMW